MDVCVYSHCSLGSELEGFDYLAVLSEKRKVYLFARRQLVECSEQIRAISDSRIVDFDDNVAQFKAAVAVKTEKNNRIELVETFLKGHFVLAMKEMKGVVVSNTLKEDW